MFCGEVSFMFVKLSPEHAASSQLLAVKFSFNIPLLYMSSISFDVRLLFQIATSSMLPLK